MEEVKKEDIKVEKESVLNFLREACEKYPDRVALIYLGKKFTYSKLNELIDRFATALDGLGIKKSDRIVIYLPNTPQFLIALYAAMKIGAVTIPISPIYTPAELGYMARDSEAETVICQDVNFGYVKEILPQSPVKRIIHTNLVDMLPWWKRMVGLGFNKVPRGKTERGEGIYKFLDLLKYPPRPPEVETDSRKDPCWILYTGGTMGLPKGVPIPPAYMYYGSLDYMDIARGTFIEKGNSRMMLVLPLFHSFSQFLFNGFVLALGNTVNLMPQPDVDAILHCIQRYKIELFAGVPTLYRMILENDRIEQYDLSSLKYCWSGGDSLPSEIFNRLKNEFNIPVRQLYGATEGGLHSYSPLSQDPKPMGVGILATSTGKKYKLLDPDTLEPVSEGEPGELLVHAPYYLNCYLNKPEETKKSYVEIDGDIYYRTKDMLVWRDKELYFVDRSADVIKYKGYRVSASEIEVVLQDHPSVLGSCVVGVPDSKVGERIKAFVVLKEDVRGVSSHDLMSFCKERLAPYKIPQYIEFRDMLPKSKVGKLLRREIRDEERRKVTTEKNA